MIIIQQCFISVVKSFVIHIKKDGSRFQDNYLELETIIEPMFNSELVEKHIGRYLRYEFMPLKYKKRIVMNGEQESNTIFMIQKLLLRIKLLGIL